MWPLHISWIIFTLVTASNTQIRANYVHLTSPQQSVKYTDFSTSKLRSYDPWKQTPEHTHIATIAISLCVRSIRTSSISYSLTYATAALHNHVWNILSSLSQNSGLMTPGDKLLNILTLATTAIFLCVRYIRTSSISYSSFHVSALPPHQCVKYILANYNN